MRSILEALVDLIYSQERGGPGTPQRITLPTALFAQFQTEFASVQRISASGPSIPAPFLACPWWSRPTSMPGSRPPMGQNPRSR